MSPFEQFQEPTQPEQVQHEGGNTERISEVFLEFQKRRLSHSIGFVATHVEAGSVNAEDYESMKRLSTQLEGLATL